MGTSVKAGCHAKTPLEARLCRFCLKSTPHRGSCQNHRGINAFQRKWVINDFWSRAKIVFPFFLYPYDRYIPGVNYTAQFNPIDSYFQPICFLKSPNSPKFENVESVSKASYSPLFAITKNHFSSSS